MLNYIKIYDIEEEDQCVCVCVCVCIKPELGDLWSRESNHLQDFQASEEAKVPHSITDPRMMRRSL